MRPSPYGAEPTSPANSSGATRPDNEKINHTQGKGSDRDHTSAWALESGAGPPPPAVATRRALRHMRSMSHDLILIVDFGSQVTQLIARRVREAGVYCEIHAFAKAGEAFAQLKPREIILSGGPASVPEPGSPRAPMGILKSRSEEHT